MARALSLTRMWSNQTVQRPSVVFVVPMMRTVFPTSALWVAGDIEVIST
jgi:hypothetical protein